MSTVTARDAQYARDYGDTTYQASGWIAFATIVLGLAGAWNVFDGILALANSKVYAVNTTYVFSDLRTWGWIITILGVLQIVAAFAIMAGSQVGRWFGIAVAGVNAIGQLMFVPAAPFWALAMFTLDVLVVYGLAVYGSADEF
jgi:hypothetical protein